jgi:intracellular sulfur oxidation DsrE/DsrF family protein
MKRFDQVLAVLITGLVCPLTMAVETTTGPVVPNFGPVLAVPADAWNLNPKQHHKVVMDVASRPEGGNGINRSLESAARFLNLHARNGIRAEQMDLVVVVHGSGVFSVLNEAAHLSRFNKPNPDQALVEELLEAGVTIYLCGQTAARRGVEKSALAENVLLAVSAMTAHVRLQQEGYALIPF